MALQRRTYTGPPGQKPAHPSGARAGPKSRRVGRSLPVCVEGDWAQARLEPPVLQILVVVANTLERPRRTDAEKGFA